MTLGQRYLLPERLVRRSWEFLRERGSHGQEGMLLWAGMEGDNAATISKLVIPGQTAVRTALSVCVAMNDDARLGLRSRLDAHERFFIRVHSHPEDAFHSATDDANLVISHDGAISIVVPRFAADAGTNFGSLAVFEYSSHDGWKQLSSGDVERRFVIR